MQLAWRKLQHLLASQIFLIKLTCVDRSFHWKHSDPDEVRLWHCLIYTGDKVEEAKFKKASYLRGIFYDYILSSTLNEVIVSLSINVSDKICFLSLPPLGFSVQVWVFMFCCLSLLFSIFAVKRVRDQTPLRAEILIHPCEARQPLHLPCQEDLSQDLSHSTTPLPLRWKGPFSTVQAVDR